MNHVRKAFNPVFGHDAIMPIEEFHEAVEYVANQYARYWPNAPKYPNIQVAQTELFHWSPDTWENMKRELWGRYVAQLAYKHLNERDYEEWRRVHYQ